MAKELDEIKKLDSAIARIQTGVMAVVCALIGGFGLFGMTAWLLIKGGENVGFHLQLLGNYFVGYSVTWRGSLVGLLYGMLFGAVIGWCIGKIYNAVADMRHGLSVSRQ
jgi:hypothetical protein